MKLEQKVSIHNRFDVEINGKWVGYGENIVLDQMWTRLCGGLSYFVNIHFGIGTGTPIASRTSLFSHLGTKTAVNEEQVKALPVSRWKRKVVLNPEEYVGQTITEVGIAFGSTASNLVTHAMLKDAEGNPISITKSDTDVVTIFATVFVTINNQSGVNMIDMPSGNQLINYLIGGSAAPTGSFGLLPFIGANSRLGSTTTVTWTSDVPNKKRKTNTPRFDINTGNGHVKYYDFTNLLEVELPAPGIFMGQPYTGVSVGTGDGVKTKFILPSANINHASLSLKVADAVMSNYTKKILLREFTKIKNPASLPPNNGRGVALTPDGLVMAVGHYTPPYITTYDWVGGAWVKRPNPAVLPTGDGYGVSLTPDGLLMAVAHGTSPFITTYDWVDGAWIKRPDPASLPTLSGRGVALTPDGLVMAVAHEISPYITTYDWIGGAWVKRPNPAVLPTSTGQGVALTPDGLVMAVVHDGTPFVTVYDWVGGAWVKRPNPTSLSSGGLGVTLTPDGLIMAVAHSVSPFIATYDWIDGAWIKRPDPAVLPSSSGYGVALTSDGLIMAVAHYGLPFIATYDWVDGAWVKRPNPAVLPISNSTGVALTPDGLVMAVAHNTTPYITTYKALPFTEVTFDSPVANTQAITADYTVDGVHKTDQYIIDVSFEIVFAEGV